MAYPVSQLITNSYYLSQIKSKGLNGVSQSELDEGLMLLNALLSVKTADGTLVPYYQSYDGTLIAGTEKYFIPNLISIESVVFFIQPIRFGLTKVNRKIYFGNPRVENINSIPVFWHSERALGGTNVYFYFLPISNYPFQIWGNFALTNVTLNQDLALSYDLYYIEYLRYALAHYMCNDYGVIFSEQRMTTLKSLEAAVNQVSPPDLVLSVKSAFTKNGGGINWGDAFIGHMWRP